jgi:hypothetical protein
MELLPNLGAEEGDDWRAFLHEPYARVAARLWSHLYSRDACFRYPAPSPKDSWRSERCENGWPLALGPKPDQPVFAWLEESDQPTAWLNTSSIEETCEEALGRRPSGPPATRIAAIHDKAFAVEAARELSLVPPALDSLIRIIDVEALGSPDALVEELDVFLRGWPDWTRQRFTFKPRLGSSGRGRVAGRGTTKTEAIRGALPRLAERGGAIFEPWLERRTDFSVALHLACPNSEPDSEPALPTILGSLEMLATASGVYRGHCGEVDSRGRIFSGHRVDETLRGDAAAVAQRALDQGFFGPCGIDAFSYVESVNSPKSLESLESGREHLRSLVEFNARATMGLVTIGLVRRALPQVREALELIPGARRAFLMGFGRPNTDLEDPRQIESNCRNTTLIDLAPESGEADPHPFLIFAHEREPLRQAHLEVLGC